MAHKSRKKHIQHTQQHQVALDPEHSNSKAHPPGTKATSAALGAGGSRKVRLTSRSKEAAKAAMKDRAGAVADRAKAAGTLAGRNDRRGVDADKRGAKHEGGLARRIAKATKKITAKPQQALTRAKARVRSLLGRDKVAG
jgi:hypothetical protein